MDILIPISMISVVCLILGGIGFLDIKPRDERTNLDTILMHIYRVVFVFGIVFAAFIAFALLE
jgi:heme/copper-type cytochrome/quinol oxidase subunit 2